MADTTPIIQKNGKGYILYLKNIHLVIGTLLGIITLVTFFVIPYNTFNSFTKDSIQDRKDMRKWIGLTDSTANVSLNYSIENNYNMRTYFSEGQPRNYQWKTYDEIKELIYRKDFRK